MGPSLVVQWLKLCASNARGLGLIPGQGTRSHMQQLRVCLSQLKNLRLQQQILKILSVAIKTRHSQINKYIYTFFLFGNLLQCSCLENSRTAEPDGLPSMGSHRVGHD